MKEGHADEWGSPYECWAHGVPRGDDVGDIRSSFLCGQPSIARGGSREGEAEKEEGEAEEEKGEEEEEEAEE